MARTGVKIEVDLTDVIDKIDETIRKVRNQREMWNEVGIEVLRSVDANFEKEGRPEAWDQLTARYLARKGGGYKILGLSGDLRRRSITHEPDNDGVTVGSNLVYAAIHQFGGPIGSKRGKGGRFVTRKEMPARPYLMLQDEDYEKIAGIIEEHMVGHF